MTWQPEPIIAARDIPDAIGLLNSDCLSSTAFASRIFEFKLSSTAVDFSHECVCFLQCFNDRKTIYVSFAQLIEPMQNTQPFIQHIAAGHSTITSRRFRIIIGETPLFFQIVYFLYFHFECELYIDGLSISKRLELLPALVKHLPELSLSGDGSRQRGVWLILLISSSWSCVKII